VGRTVRLDGQPFTVVGVVPADLRLDAVAAGANRPRLWTLLDLPRDRSPAQRYAHYLTVIGRLDPSATPEAAHTDMNAIASAIARESPATNEGHGVALEPLHARIIGPELRLTSLLLLGVVGFVLLMCCANIANLLLARTTARARELAVRSALGAGRRRIVRQLFTESLVLAALGGGLGAAVGALLLAVAPSVVPAGLLPHAVTLAFGGRVLAFCAAAALLVAVAFGVAPAWHATGLSVTQAISLDSRTATGRGAWFRSLLAAGQVAAAVLLLCGAGLLLRTLVALERVDPGHRARNVLTMVVSPGMSGTPDSWRQFYDAVAREVEGVPGVRHVAFGSSLPLDGSWYAQAFEVEGDPPRAQADRDGAGYQMVSGSYFRTLGIPMVAGREFGGGDSADGPQVCIVDEAFVRRYLAGRDPIGTHLVVQAMVQPSQALTRQIVGVVRDVPEQPGEAEAQPHIYVPLAQNTWWSASLVVQASDGPAAALVPAIRAAVARVDPDRPVTDVRTMEEIASAGTVRPRFRTALVGAFALLALGLAMVGVFGVLAYAVQQRTRELGVRIALGATGADVLRLVLASAARITVAGAAAGLAAAALMGRWIAALLFGVEPADPVTFVAVAGVLAVTAALATAAPALRAMRVDPAVTFRNE
jgi:putative ABC transport system permease protein